MIRTLAVLSFLALTAAPASAQGASPATQATPATEPQIEKGRQVVAQVCAACHTTIVRMVQVHKQTPAQWRDTVFFMISRGAQIMPDEIESVIAFLAATSGSGTGTGTGTGRGGGAGGRQPAAADGAAILQRTCQQCHDLATATKKPDLEDWSAVVSRMTTYGARLTPADRDKLIEYLNGLKK